MWRPTPAQRFLLGSLLVLGLGMAGVGLWVTRQIEDGVVHRTAATTALYVDSLIAPSLQGLAADGTLPAEARDRLDWLISDTALGQQVAIFQVWDRAGRIVYSLDPALVGRQFLVEGHLAEALAGEVTAEIGDPEAGGDDTPSGDLLEIYSPIRLGGTDEVIAVAEFYYATDDLMDEIADARRRSWLVLAGATLLIYLVLAVFVQRSSNIIVQQQRALAAQVDRLTDLLSQNEALHERVRGAAARTTALNERFLRRFSAELHDGPAQDISLALLRLDHVDARCSAGGMSPDTGAETLADLNLIRTSLQRALQEVRAASGGLLLPQLGTLTISQTVEHAVRGHLRRTGAPVETALGAMPERAPLPTKIALYRLIQEALTNAWRHAGGQGQIVAVERDGDRLRVAVGDAGPGFDATTIGDSEEHLGLVGMRERVESLGGTFSIESAPQRGTRVVALLPLQEPGGPDG
jgi:signal transduction histidine kinase